MMRVRFCSYVADVILRPDDLKKPFRSASLKDLFCFYVGNSGNKVVNMLTLKP